MGEVQKMWKKICILIFLSFFVLACKENSNEQLEKEIISKNNKKIEKLVKFPKYSSYLDLYISLYFQGKMLNDFIKVLDKTDYTSLNKNLSQEEYIAFKENFSKNIDEVYESILYIKKIDKSSSIEKIDEILVEMEEILPKLKGKLFEVVDLYISKNKDGIETKKVYEEFSTLYSNYLDFEEVFILEMKNIENDRYKNLIEELKIEKIELVEKIENFIEISEIFYETVKNQETIEHITENEEAKQSFFLLTKYLLEASNEISTEIVNLSDTNENQEKYINSYLFAFVLSAQSAKELVFSIDSKSSNINEAIKNYEDIFYKIFEMNFE